jgi:hypothetical protein
VAETWWDQQYGEYFTGMSTLGGNVKASPLYGNQQFKNLIFNFGCLGQALQLSVTKEYLVPALEGVMPHDRLVMAYEIARQFTIQFTIIGAGAGIGALIGGTAGTAVPIPLVGTIAGAGSGAVIGASIASWILFGVGLAELAGQGPYIVESGKDEIERGVQIAMKGDAKSAAKEFADFFAQILVVIIPMILVAFFAKGCRAMGGVLYKNPAMALWLDRYLFTPGNYARASRILGYTEDEIRAYAEFSRGKILVARWCKPSRLKYIEEGYPGKPVAVHKPWNTARMGQKEGLVVCNVSDAGDVTKDYELKVVNGSPDRFELMPRAQADARTGRTLRNQDALLEGHFVQRFVDTDGVAKYLLLNRAGKPFVGDIDRVLYGEFRWDGTIRVGTRWKNDDPREVAYMNEQIRRRLAKPVSYNVFQHGHAWENLVQKDGKTMPGWPYRDPGTGSWDFADDEQLLVAVNGNIYILDWEKFAAFCDAFKKVGLLFPWFR